MPGFSKTLKFPFSTHTRWFFLWAAAQAGGLIVASQAFAQQKGANPPGNETIDSPPESIRSRKSPAARSSSGGESRTPRTQKQTGAVSFGSGIYIPLTRPNLSLSFSALNRHTELTIRLAGSYTSLSESFQEAAASNESYASKISKADAYLWDLDLAVPELTILLPASFYVAATTFGRYSRCVSNYTTSNDSPLLFTGWSLAVGAGGRAGYRYPLSGDNFFLDFYGGLTWPVWSAGSAEVSYLNLNTQSNQTFSESDLDAIRDSLQVYLKGLSYQVTTEAGIRAAWRF